MLSCRWVVLSLVAVLLVAVLVACGAGGDALPPDGGAGADTLAPDTVPTRVSFADDNLEACVREALGRDQGKAKKQDLRPVDLQGLTQLQCPDRRIQRLDGLEHAMDLEHLSLWENDLTTIKALAGLTRLTSLQLGNNLVADLTPLAKLTRLRRLGLAQNEIDDLKPLTGLKELRWLNLDHNKIDEQDLAALAGLKQLKWLTAEATKAKGAGPLKPLTSAGTQVYMGLAAKPAASAGRGADLPAQPPPRGELFIAPGAPTDPVRFEYRVEGQPVPLLREFSGEVVRRGAQLRYRGRRVRALAVGRKAGLDATGAPGAVYTLSLELEAPTPVAAPAPGTVDKNLVPLAFASPNQFDAGSCLFMATTGAVELLMNQQLDDPSKMKYQGPTDLSERYLMNASNHVPKEVVRYAVTDVLFTYDYLGGSLLNKDYPFTAGYVTTTSSGGVTKAEQGEEGATFSCKYNWIDELPAGYKQLLVQTPATERTLIFLDPKLDQQSRWRVGLASDDVVQRIKWELRTKQAPVIVVYNHYLYWHASVVVGYDDSYATGGCPMVQSMLTYFTQQGATSYVNTIKDQMSKQGGCSTKGAFYVRDSIYDGTSEEPSYSYSSKYSFTKKYSKRIVLRSYNWVKYVANHAYTVQRD